jgi:hypothetical protein
MCGIKQATEKSRRSMLKFLKQRRYVQSTIYVLAIVLLIAPAVYGVMEQSSFADALVESFIE